MELKCSSNVSVLRNVTLSFLLFGVTLSVGGQNPLQRKMIQQANKLNALRKFARLKEVTPEQTNLLNQQATMMGLPIDTIFGNQAVSLAGFTDTGRPIYKSVRSRQSAYVIGTGYLWNSQGIYNLEGQNITFYQWDRAQPLITHQELVGRVTIGDNSSYPVEHSTNVASAIIASGINPLVRGMAPQGRLIAYDWRNDLSEVTLAAEQGALLGNASYGEVCGWATGDYGAGSGYYWMGGNKPGPDQSFGAYGTIDRSIDYIATQAPYYLHIIAAGNDNGYGGPGEGKEYFVFDETTKSWIKSTMPHPRNGGTDGFDCITTGTVGKNSLAVGALSRAHALIGQYERAGFSSAGPVNDGRIKPDVMAVGTDINLASYYDAHSYNDADGTSFSAPMVTGSLGLIQQCYSEQHNGMFLKSHTIRALIINTTKEAGKSIGPDYHLGWGVLDTKAAVEAVMDMNAYSLVEEATLTNGEKKSFTVKAKGGTPIRITLAWTDPASPTLTDINKDQDRTAALVNDLDIRVTGPNGEFMPWMLNPANPAAPAVKGDNTVDNVEQILIENPVENGEYTITVSHKGQLRKNTLTDENIQLTEAESQDFALVATGLNMASKNIEIVSVNVLTDVMTNNTPVEIKLKNTGTTDINDISVVLERRNEEQTLETKTIKASVIHAGETTTLQTTADLSLPYQINLLRANVAAPGDQVGSDNTVVTKAVNTIVDLRNADTEIVCPFESDMNNYGWTTAGNNTYSKGWYVGISSKNAYAGNGYVISRPYNSSRTDQWLFSSPIRVTPGDTYKLSFYARTFSEANEVIKVAMGETQTNDAMVTNIGEATLVAGKGYQRYEYAFTPTTETVYIGFHHKANPDYTSIAVGMDQVSFANVTTNVEKVGTDGTLRVSKLEDKLFFVTTDNLPINSISVWSIDGKTVLQTYPNTSTATINLNHCSSGVYGLQIKTSDGKKHIIKLLVP